MNKLVKGSIATAAGVALLLGGAGTFALWSDTAGVQGGTVNTGRLDINTVANSASWTDVTPGATSTTFNPATQKIVPGDTIAYKQQVTVAAEGKNLKAELTLSKDALAVKEAFANAGGTVTLTAASNGNAALTANGAGYTVVPSSAVSTLDVTVTIAFPSTVTGQTAENLASVVDLSKVGFTLTQK